ncbi:MAG: division/cell wall cluster transcriptional repressor MraZ [Algicola sp.]|nr:division/cell wall cluster transcriptional repressor MraZ [Algicola sp.]
MYRGASSITIDSKGRLAIPTKFRELLVAECQGEMICTIDIHQPCLLLYPLTEWEEVEAKLRKLSSMNPHERRVQRLLLGHASECKLDGNGRTLISGPLRNHASLQKNIMLVGQLNKFEIWDEAIWQQQVEQDIELENAGGFELTERLQDFSF